MPKVTQFVRVLKIEPAKHPWQVIVTVVATTDCTASTGFSTAVPREFSLNEGEKYTLTIGKYYFLNVKEGQEISGFLFCYEAAMALDRAESTAVLV